MDRGVSADDLSSSVDYHLLSRTNRRFSSGKGEKGRRFFSCNMGKGADTYKGRIVNDGRVGKGYDPGNPESS